MKNNWLITVRFKDLPEDADSESMNIFIEAILDSNMAAEYEIVKVEKEKE